MSSTVDVAVVGAGAAGIGCGVALSMLDLEVRVVEREAIGASFRAWPEEMRFITPSFPSNSFGLTDLNAVTPNTSPAVALDTEHPSGEQYADYLESVAEFYEIDVETGIEVRSVRSVAEGEGEDGATPARAADGATAREGFVLETNAGSLACEQVVWAAGQFANPRTDVFPGAESCVHTAGVGSWADHAERGEEFLVVGGYESGIDAAIGLVEAGGRVRVVDRGEPWDRRGPDPSEVLSPYTVDRLESVAGSDRLVLEGGAVVEGVECDGDEYRVRTRAAEGYELDAGRDATYTVPTPPILATGFEPALGPVTEAFPREEGTIRLTDRDESPTTPGLFLAGPAVAHDGVSFCFVYKFRARFPVIAETIGSRLGVETAPLEVYREQGMFLEDLSCCEPDMCDC